MGCNNTCYRDITSFLSLLLSFTTGFSVSPPASWASNRSTNSTEGNLGIPLDMKIAMADLWLICGLLSWMFIQLAAIYRY